MYIYIYIICNVKFRVKDMNAVHSKMFISAFKVFKSTGTANASMLTSLVLSLTTVNPCKSSFILLWDLYSRVRVSKRKLIYE